MEIRLKNILLATDFSPASDAALAHALTIADRYGSKLHVAHVICPEFKDLMAPELAETTLKHAQAFAEQEMGRLLSIGRKEGVSCQRLIGQGVIADVLMEMVSQNRIDLVVVGTRGRRGLRKLLLGSVAEEVFRLAPCPVLTVGPGTSEKRPADVQLRRILYPVEYAPDSGDAATYAVSLAEEFHANLIVMKVFEEMVSPLWAEAQVEEPFRHWVEDHIPAESDLRERTSFELGYGAAGEAILKLATDRAADLIVMGARRLDPVIAAHLLKPDTASEVVRNARCPVLTVR